MQHDLLNNRREINKDIYTNQSNFIIESQKFLNQESMITVRKHTRFVDFPKHKHDYQGKGLIDQFPCLYYKDSFLDE